MYILINTTDMVESKVFKFKSQIADYLNIDRRKVKDTSKQYIKDYLIVKIND